MALTKAQELALYQILEVPYATSVNVLDSMHGLTATQIAASVSARQAKTMITAHLVTVAADSDLEAVLTELLDEWIALGTVAFSIELGGVGGVSGLTDSPEAERLEIRRRVLVIVPFYRVHEELTSRSAPAGELNLFRN